MKCDIEAFTDDGWTWFGRVVNQDEEELHTTGPRSTPEEAEYAAENWLRGYMPSR